MMNKNLKSMVKRIFAGVMTISLVLGFTTVNAYAYDANSVRQVVTERRVKAQNTQMGKLYKEGDTYKMSFLYPNSQIPATDAKTSMEKTNTEICAEGCKNIMTTYVKTSEGYEYYDECLDCMLSQGCPINPEEINSPEIKQFMQALNSQTQSKQEAKKEEVKKEEVKPEAKQENSHVKDIKEMRKYFIDNGINDRENNGYFQVFVNNEMSNVKLGVNDPISVDESGICTKEHRHVSYFTKNSGILEHVSKCLDCKEQRITAVNEVMPGMNVLGSNQKVAKTEEKVQIKGLTDEEKAEIIRNYKLAEIKEAIDSLE